MKKINPEWFEVLKSVVNHSPYFQLQQMALKDLAWGTSRVEIDIENRHMQPFGIVHGGVFSSLLDATGFWAVYSITEQDVGMATLELKMNYLAPAISDRQLIGIGQCIKLGQRIGLGEARIENENGKLLAHGTTTVMLKFDMYIDEKVMKIPKFIMLPSEYTNNKGKQ